MTRAVCLVLLAASLVAAQAPADPVAALIQAAGNAADDAARLGHLRALRALPGLDAGLAKDLDRLLFHVDRWVHGTSLAAFQGFDAKGIDWPMGIPEDSPLYPQTWLYRGRAVTWRCLENGNLWGYPEVRRQWLDRAAGYFRNAAAAFPDNPLPQLYLGEPGPWPRALEPDPQAPAWANDQRAALEGLTDIIEWWIEHRQQADGQYGGGWGDDCEMWRWWVPVLIGFESAPILKAQERFSRAMMRQEHLRGGFTTALYDVEHTAEDTADVITPMLHLAPDSGEWQGRALRLAELMRERWTGRNARGGLQFKSTYFSVDRVSENPAQACDTVYHPRTVQPALLHWQRTGDPALTRLFGSWLDTWVDAAARAERGKPAGVLPSAIHWPDGGVGGTGPDWWDPQNHSEPGLYRWPSALSLMTNTLLLASHLTGDAKYLAPIHAMARLRLAHQGETGPPGSAAWCAANLGPLDETLAKYRLLTGDPAYDALLRARSPYLAFRLTGDRAALDAALRRAARAVAVNFAGYTSEVRYTDRVLRFPQLFSGEVVLARPREELASPSPSLLYSAVTGDPGDALYFPLNAVRWLTPPRGLAALVTATGPRRLTAELYAFDAAPRALGAEFYLLEPGDYRLTITPARGRPTTQALRVGGARGQVHFTLPARTLCRLTVAP